jgi:hypothetical protein
VQGRAPCPIFASLPQKKRIEMKINWGTGIAITIGAFMLMILGFVFNSLQHESELVAEDYYQQELDYQRRIQELHRAQEAGLSANALFDRQGLLIAYPEQGWAGTVTFFRPSDRKLDFTVPIAPDSAGRQRIEQPLASGLWRLQFSWANGGEQYYSTQSIIAP